jgi:folate receptor
MKLIAVLFVLFFCCAFSQECRPMGEIYRNGKDLCEKMWDNSFRYVNVSESSEPAYTMWWFSQANPNDVVTQQRIALGLHDVNYSNTDVCHLQYFHLDRPIAQPDSFTECHPYKDRSCCAERTVESADTLRLAYGPGYDWNRCGKLSAECARFFVQEACFYECSPNAGLFRKFSPLEFNESDASHNEWQLEGMPIRGDYCDSWFDACHQELFCALDGGSFFSCAAFPAQSLQVPVVAIVLSVVGGAIGILALLMMVYLIRREKSGNPLFVPLKENELTEPIPL